MAKNVDNTLWLSLLLSFLLLISTFFLSALVYSYFQLQIWGLLGDGYREPNVIVRSLFYIFPIMISLLPVGIYILSKRRKG